MSSNQAIKEHAKAIGFDFAGVAPVSVLDDLAFSREWVERGYSGSMSYLANPKRDDPRLVMPSVRSVICVGLTYNTDFPYSTEAARSADSPYSEDTGIAESGEHPRGWISRYAWGQDYHEIIRVKLERLREAIQAMAPGVETRVYVDTGPLVERAFARHSGIGWTGKNTCLINQSKGSWFFIGVILTNLDLEPDLPAADRCGSCTRCLEACPTGALVQPYVMDASRCIAYFNIELRGSIPVEFRPSIGANLFGCDICQDVCPWNGRPAGPAVNSGRDAGIRVGGRNENSGTMRYVSTVSAEASKNPKKMAAERSLQSIRENAEMKLPRGDDRRQTGWEPAEPSPAARPRLKQAALTSVAEFQPLNVKPAAAESPFSLFNPSIRDLASVTEGDFRNMFTRSPVKRAKYRGWLRNLCIIMGNSGDPSFIPWLERIRAHDDPMVREHADWALDRLKARDFKKLPSADCCGPDVGRVRSRGT